MEELRSKQFREDKIREECHMERQCTKPKKPKNSAWFKEKEIPTLATFQTNDLDAFDSDCDKAPSASAVLMGKLSSYDSAALLEIMLTLMRTQSAGRPVVESRGGGTGVRVGRGGGRGRGPKLEGVNENVKEVNEGVGGAPDFLMIIAQHLQNFLPAMPAQVGNQGNVGNQNGNVVNENVQENVKNILLNGNQVGCSYKEFLACNQKEYDGKGGVVVLTRWIEKMEYVQDMSGCSEVAVSMPWNDFKFIMIEEFCPSHEMQKLETELWNHVMVGAGHDAYIDRFHELARLVPHLVTPKSRKTKRNGSINKVRKKGNVGEPSKDKNGREDNIRTMTGNAFVTTANPVGRENTGGNHPKEVVANNGGQDHGNQWNQAQGRAFMLGAEEARQDSNIMTGIEPSKLGFRYEIEIASGQLVEIDKVKDEHERPSGLLQQAEIPVLKWKGMAMDFVNKLPRTSSGSWDVHLLLVEFLYNNSYHSSVRCAPFEVLYGRKFRSPIMWVEVGEGQLIGLELVQETNEKISQIKDRLKVARDRQKSYAGVVRFGKKGKFAPRFVRPFEIVKKVGPVSYQLDLPEELNGVNDTFHVSNLKKCLADPTLQVPLDEIQVNSKLNFVEEPLEILKKEFKTLKRSRIFILKVRWNSKRGLEFTWKRDDQMKLKYPHLFSDVSS
nr:putative reverse transcriptase domain-containing protein [Tanacetum cinerariifolium]